MCEFVSAVLMPKKLKGRLEAFSSKEMDSHSDAVSLHDLNDDRCVATVEWTRVDGVDYLTVLSSDPDVPDERYEKYVLLRWHTRQEFVNYLLLSHLRAGRLPAGLQNLSFPHWTPESYLQFCRDEFSRMVDTRHALHKAQPDDYLLHHYWKIAEKAMQAYTEAPARSSDYIEQRLYVRVRVKELLKNEPMPNPSYDVAAWYSNGNGVLAIAVALTLLKFDDVMSWADMRENERSPLDAMQDALMFGVRTPEELHAMEKGVCDRFLAALEKAEKDYVPA